MHGLTGFQRDLMIVLSGMGEPNGREIKEELERTQSREIHHARLYANLDALVEEGYVEKGSRDGRTNRYATTRKGDREVEARFQWEEEHLFASRTVP